MRWMCYIKKKKAVDVASLLYVLRRNLLDNLIAQLVILRTVRGLFGKYVDKAHVKANTSLNMKLFLLCLYTTI